MAATLRTLFSAAAISLLATNTDFTTPASSQNIQICHKTAEALPDAQLYGQLLIVGFRGTKPGDAGVERAYQNIRKGRVGGVILFGPNIVSPGQVRRLNKYLLSANPPNPPFIAVDEEGGRVQRLKSRNGFSNEPSALAVGGLGVKQADAIYANMARELSRLGFNLNFGPVVDLHKPGNPVIARNKRSYSASPEKVVRYARSFIKAHHKYGVLTALKHYPGHGFSRTDTHHEFTDVTNDWDPKEEKPYADLVKAKSVDMVMTAHLINRKDWSKGNGLPASLSPTTAFKLRQLNGYRGVVITDDLQMKAITKGRSLGDAIVMALSGANDIALVGNALAYKQDTASYAIAKISAAVKSERLDRPKLVRSYCRIQALKLRLKK